MKLDKNKKYLFICQFGQSRSRYFAERFMEMGIKSLFCGFDDNADIVLNKNLIKHYDILIILDKDFYRNIKLIDLIDYYEKEYIKFYIDDEPINFDNKFREFMEKFEK